MNALASPSLDVRLAELLMSSLVACDLGDAIEVVHDVEAIEIEMDCDLGEDAPDHSCDETERMVLMWFETDDDHACTTAFERVEEIGTHRFVRDSAPYERIELKVDNAFVRATIEEARLRGSQRAPR